MNILLMLFIYFNYYYFYNFDKHLDYNNFYILIMSIILGTNKNNKNFVK